MILLIRLFTISICVCLLFVLTEGITGNTTSEFPLYSHPEESSGLNHTIHLNKTDYNETLQAFADNHELFNNTGSGNTTCNGTCHNDNLSPTLPGLPSDEVLNISEGVNSNGKINLILFETFNETSNFTSFENFNETSNFTSFENFDDTSNFTVFENFNGTSNLTSFDDLTVTTTEEPYVYIPEVVYKFIEPQGIIIEHIDFVLLRLKRILMKTSSNITELLELQQEEFEVNDAYRSGWEEAMTAYNVSQRNKIFNNTTPDSIVQQVPEEYHIALVGYAGWMYSAFNKDTREVCSGKDINSYKWKSYFKLLQLAIEALGTQEEKWRDDKEFLYRGVSVKFELKEGQVVAFQHFVSASVDLLVAERFSKKSGYYWRGESVFEFQGLYNGTAMAVWDHSIRGEEGEYLFSPLQAFRVDSIHVGYYYTRYVLVKHEMPILCDLNVKPKLGHNLNNITKSFLHAHSGTAMHVSYVLKIAFLTLLLDIVTSLIL